MQPKLGILAGGGLLPACIVATCQKVGRPFHVIAFKGQTEGLVSDDIPHSEIRLGAGGHTLKALRENGVEEIILAGGIVRPTLAQLRPDAWGIKFLARSGAMALGDDGLLTALLRTLEDEEGFRVVGVPEVAPDLLAPEGAIGAKTPNTTELNDLHLAIQAALDLGAKDMGQAAIVRNSVVIGLEDAGGTDKLLQKIAADPDAGNTLQAEGVLAKVAKPQQERRADLPTIGVETIKNVSRAGLAGIAVEAGGALILERAKVAALADELGLFVVGVRVDGDSGYV